MTPEQLEALRYYITAVVQFMTRDGRCSSYDLEAARMNLEDHFGHTLHRTPQPEPGPFDGLIL